MTTTKTEETAAPAPSLGARPDGAKQIGTALPGALAVGSRAYVNGVLDLGRTLMGFGREVAAEASQHLRSTIEAKTLREAAELQAAWAQHRVETSTAHAKEFADLTHARTMDVIAPFVALLKQDKAA